MSFKYKLAAALISLPIFFSVFFFPCLQIRASAAVSDSWVDRLAAYQVSKWEDLPSDFQALAQAYVNTFNSIGTKGYFESVTDIPLNWYYILDDTTPVLSIGGAVFYYLDSSGNLKYTKKGSSGTNSIEDNATPVDSRDKLAVDGKTFQKHIEDNKNGFAPTGSTSRVSWKTDKYFSSSSCDPVRSWYTFTFLDKLNFFGVSGLKKCYIVPFFENSDGLYFSSYCIYFELLYDDSETPQVNDWVVKYVDVLNSTADLHNSDEYAALFDNHVKKLSDVKSTAASVLNDRLYVSFGEQTSYKTVRFFGSLENYLQYKFSGDYASYTYRFNLFEDFFWSTFYSSQNRTFTVSNIFNAVNFPKGSLSGAPCDWGFYISDTPILMDGFGADIDTTKIPDNYYITVGGDTIYDYNITNPATGDTTTINNYITNNYAYITNPGGGSGGTVNNYYDGATINNGDNHYYDGATINNGDNITNNYNFSEGDTNFFTQIGIEIQNALNFAFVPSDSYMDKFNIDLRNTLESKIPFVYDIGDIFNSFFVEIVDDNLVYVSDINSDGSVDESSIIYPKWTFNVNFFGNDYELVYLDFSMYSESFFYIRLVVACFTYLGFFVMLLRSLPGIIGNVGDLVGASYSLAPYAIERFSDVPKGGD